MKIEKVTIRDTEIPFKNGTVRWIYYGGVMAVEMELDVHPTIVDFINSSGFLKEKVRITSDNNTEMVGKFTIYTGKSGILLTSDINEIVGVEKIAPTMTNTESCLLHSDRERSLRRELKEKQKTILITFFNSMLESDLIDDGNREFIYTLVEKLTNGKPLSKFDHYLIDEFRYVMEETIHEAKHPSFLETAFVRN